MLRKIMASFLSVLMMLSATCFVVETVDAAENYSITLTDNFDQYATLFGYSERAASNAVYFPSAAHKETSSVFLTQTTTTPMVRPWLPKNHEDIGLTSPALCVQQSNANTVSLKTVALPFKTALETCPDMVMEFKTDIMLISNVVNRSANFGGYTPYDTAGTSAVLFSLVPDGSASGFKRIGESTVIYNPKLNSWYTLVVRQTGSGREAYITDSEGNVVVSSLETSGVPSRDEACDFKFDLYATASESKFSYLLDNVTLRMYEEVKEAPMVVGSTIKDDGLNVSTSSTYTDVTFTQEIANFAEANVTLTAEGGQALSCTMKKNSQGSGTLANNYRITFPSSKLASDTEYTIDLSSLENGSGVALAGNTTIKFDTGAHAPRLKSATPENGDDSVPIDEREITFVFDQDLTSYPEKINILSANDVIAAEVKQINKRNYLISFFDRFEPITEYEINLSDFASANGACETGEYTFKTEYDEIVTYSDGFDVSSYIKSTTSNSSYTSNVIIAGSATTGTDVNGKAVYTLETVADGDYALKTKTGANTSKNYTKVLRTKDSYSITEDEKLVATWRFNLKDMADWDATTTAGAFIPMGIDVKTASSTVDSMMAFICTDSNGRPQIYHEDDSQITAKSIKEDNWYNVVYSISNYTQELYVVDANPESATYASVVYSKMKSTDTPVLTADKPYYIHIAGSTVAANEDGLYYNTNQEYLINDFTLWRVNPESPYMSLQLDEENSDKSMNPNGTISLSFNQPIMAYPDGIEVYKEDGTIENIRSMSQIKWTNFCEQEISITNLESLSNYIMDYQELKAVSGAGVYELSKPTAIYEFETTNVMETTPVFVGDIECTGLGVGDKISFELYAPEAIKGTLVVGMYKRFPSELLQIKTSPIEISATNTDSFEFTLTEECAGATYIKAFVWENFDSLVPLVEAYKELSPVDAIDVLMIGSSVTEDMQRYLCDLSDAGGVVLNLTSKTISSASLSDHATNLAAELDGTPVATYVTYENGGNVLTEGSESLLDALEQNTYEVVALQQFGSYLEENIDTSLDYLITEIRKLQPEAEIYLIQPWSPYYEAKVDRNNAFNNTIKTPVYDWAAYAGKTVEFASVNGEPLSVVPVGAAFFAADQKYSWAGATPSQASATIEDTPYTDDVISYDMKMSSGLYRDYNHASWYGSYLAGAVWYEMLTGSTAPYCDAYGDAIVPAPNGVSEEEHLERLVAMSAIAHETVLRNK